MWPRYNEWYDLCLSGRRDQGSERHVSILSGRVGYSVVFKCGISDLTRSVPHFRASPFQLLCLQQSVSKLRGNYILGSDIMSMRRWNRFRREQVQLMSCRVFQRWRRPNVDRLVYVVYA